MISFVHQKIWNKHLVLTKVDKLIWITYIQPWIKKSNAEVSPRWSDNRMSIFSTQSYLIYHFRTFSDFILLCLIFYFNDADSLVIVFMSTAISVLQIYFMNVSVLSVRKCTQSQIIFIYKLHNFYNLAHKLNLRKTLDIIKMNISWFTF